MKRYSKLELHDMFLAARKLTGDFREFASQFNDESAATIDLAPVTKAEYVAFLYRAKTTANPTGAVHIDAIVEGVHKVKPRSLHWGLAKGRTSSWLTTNDIATKVKGIVERATDTKGNPIEATWKLTEAAYEAEKARLADDQTVGEVLESLEGEEEESSTTPPATSKPKPKATPVAANA